VGFFLLLGATNVVPVGSPMVLIPLANMNGIDSVISREPVDRLDGTRVEMKASIVCVLGLSGDMVCQILLIRVLRNFLQSKDRETLW
jgi:hypothetical protein